MILEMLIDIFISIYMAIEDKYQIQPHECLVRNWGNDGSGLHCSSDDSNIAELEVSSNTNFVIEFEKEYDNRKMEEKQIYQDSRSFSDRQVTWFVILSGIYRLLGPTAQVPALRHGRHSNQNQRVLQPAFARLHGQIPALGGGIQIQG